MADPVTDPGSGTTNPSTTSSYTIGQLLTAVNGAASAAGTNMQSAIAGLQGDGKTLKIEDMFKLQADMGAYSVAVTTLSGVLKETIESMKGVAQKVG